MASSTDFLGREMGNGHLVPSLELKFCKIRKDEFLHNINVNMRVILRKLYRLSLSGPYIN